MPKKNNHSSRRLDLPHTARQYLMDLMSLHTQADPFELMEVLLYLNNSITFYEGKYPHR